MKTGIELIAHERERQVKVEGWSEEHDDTHKKSALAVAAVEYANCSIYQQRGCEYVPLQWPWGMKWWKPSSNKIRNLVKAGALIAAEIDRLQRVKSD
jgi:hypothetical protein